MISFKYSLYLFLFSAVLFWNCAQVESENSISVEQLQTEIKTDRDLLILDVRNPSELSGPLRHIDGVINIPVQELDSRLDELKEYNGRKIAVICRSGRRSLTATKILLENGFSAFNVTGGMIKYRETKTGK